MTRIVVPAFIDEPSEAPRLLAEAGDQIIPVRFGDGDKIGRVGPLHRSLAAEVASTLAGGDRLVALLGDCCQTIPVMAGLARAGITPTILWLDSHGDFNTWETTPSQFLGGMPLAMLTGRGEQTMLENVDFKPIADARVVLSDARDLDPGERLLVQQSGIRHLTNIADIMREPLPAGPLYVHLDLDIIDASTAPAFRYPVVGGPSAREVAAVIAHVRANYEVVAASVCCSWAPAQDSDGRTLAAVRTAATSLLG